MESTSWRDLWILFIPIAVSPLLALAIIGIFFAPFASILSAGFAWRHGRNPWEASFGGFWASIILFLPWVCLIAKNLGWRHTNVLIELSLAAVMGIWGCFSIGILTMVGILWVFAYFLSLITGGIFAGAAGTSILYAPLGFIVILINGLLWWRLHRVLSLTDYSDWAPESHYVPLIYVEPFVAAYFWSVATPLILIGVGWAALNFTFGAV